MIATKMRLVINVKESFITIKKYTQYVLCDFIMFIKRKGLTPKSLHVLKKNRIGPM